MIASLATLAARGAAPRWMSLDGGPPALHFSDLLSGTAHTLSVDGAPLAADFPH